MHNIPALSVASLFGCVPHKELLAYMMSTKGRAYLTRTLSVEYLGPELQCLLRVKEDLRLVLIFQDAKNNV